MPRPAHAAPMPRGTRVALTVALIVAWVAGSTLGVTPSPVSPRTAQAIPLLQIEPAHAEFEPALDGSEPVFILVLGSDARPGEEITGQRADSIHIVALNPATGRASIVGFPRDAYVEIPGIGSEKINGAMVHGGPELVVETVESLTGLTMHYWALTWFDGFVAMINDIEGLRVDVPFAVYDQLSHAEIDAGVQILSGRDALAYARARHVLPSGDFGRSENQGRLMIAALQQFQKAFHRDPTSIFSWVGAGMRNARTDIALDQLMTLAFTGATLTSKRVTNIVIPGTLAMNGTESIVNLDDAALDAISRDLEADGTLGKKNIPVSPNADLMPGEDMSATEDDATA